MSMRSFHSNMAVDLVHPPSVIASGTLPAAFLDMSDFDYVVFLIAVGTMGAADTLLAQVVQATLADGTGEKDVTGALITTLVDADDDTWASIEVKGSALDVAGGFRFVALDMTEVDDPDGCVFALRYRGGGLPPAIPAKYAEQIQVS